MDAARQAKRKATRSGKLKLGRAILAEQRDFRTWKFRLEVLRNREIERLIQHRHGVGFSDTDDGPLYAEAIALGLSRQDLTAWCKRWAPMVTAGEIAELESKASQRKRMLGADPCAQMLCVTMAERTALGLKTIGAVDATSEERAAIAKERKREHDRTRQERNRKAEGRKDRRSYEAESISQKKPWEALGMKRATWYRKGKPEIETGVSRVEQRENGDTLVSRRQGEVAAPAKPDLKNHMDKQIQVGQKSQRVGNETAKVGAAGDVGGAGDYVPRILKPGFSKRRAG